ncbi:MAG: hypothetical protein M1816_005119 [Peltula sp. TS41687]|nr:MAG: hypothetical protein M1816_005119 [Peltula sp. TS41687]
MLLRSTWNKRPKLFLSPLSGRHRRRSLLTLAIETSCDDTCVAVLEKHDASPASNGPKDGTPTATLHFHEKITSDNRRFGGIHPLIALASHQANLGKLVEAAIQALPSRDGRSNDARHQVGPGTIRHEKKRLPDFISVTRGPGMRSNLNTGLDTAKGLALGWQVPLVAVNHMQAHALTPRLISALNQGLGGPLRPSFPFLSLLVSGGHTMLVHCQSLTDYRTLASTVDIAIGDMLDKAARVILPKEVLDLSTGTMYGALLEKFVIDQDPAVLQYTPPSTRTEELSRKTTAWGWALGSPLAGTKSRSMEYSFTGLESAVRRRFNDPSRLISIEERTTLGRELMRVAFEHLASRIILGLDEMRTHSEDFFTTTPDLVVSGGVASNSYLRIVLRQFLDIRGYSMIRLIFPPTELCTDNAAMIAWTGIEMFEAGWATALSCQALRWWPMDPASEDGGILKVPDWISHGGSHHSGNGNSPQPS